MQLRTRVVLTILILSACSGGERPASAPTRETVVPPETGMVALTAQGVQLKPPARTEQIPEGAWYCDMGTVHFAATEKNDGKCALCGMDLVHQGEP